VPIVDTLGNGIKGVNQISREDGRDGKNCRELVENFAEADLLTSAG